MSEFHSIRPSIYLNYGVDAVDAEDAACEVCERGMRFKSPWQFTLGTVLGIAFVFEEAAPCRVDVEACVVECLAGEGSEYQITLAFVEAPQELRASLGKVALRLNVPSHCAGPRLVSKPCR